ncbi:MAG: acyltransferase [Pseudobutyrivibrio sp.]|nr:acyltransferase [Pseudobutyrivibrio sp.]
MGNERHKIRNTAGMFDLLKGITMLMVIFVHTYSLFPDSFLFQNTYQADLEVIKKMDVFHHLLLMAYSVFAHSLMPAFFVVSGYGIRKMDFAKCLKKQSKTLLIPYAITAGLTSILHLCTHYTLYRYFPGSFVETLRIAGGFLFGLSKPSYYFDVKIFSCGPIWFILALFWGIVIFNMLVSVVSEKYLPYASLAVAFVGWLLSLGNTVPWCVSQGLVAVFYICLGYMAKKKKWFIEGTNTKEKIILVLFGILPNAIMRFIGYMDGMADNIYPFSIGTIIVNGFMGLVCVYVFLLLNGITGVISSFLRKLGRLSIYIMCIHTIEMMGFPYYYFANNWTGNVTVGLVLLYLVRATIDVVICFVFVAIKDRLSGRN